MSASQKEHWARVMICATVLSLSLFGCVASTAVLLFLIFRMGVADAFALRLALKSIAFLLLAITCGFFLYRNRCTIETSIPRISPRRSPFVYLAPVLALAAICVVPRLNEHPWLAPDELHHLTVARNLAQFGTYASGHASAGLIPFDDYDSVGAPVLMPVAAAFKLAGVSIQPARLTMALYFLSLCALLFFLINPIAGPVPAAVGVACMLCGFGSIYLGRTLYGEVPALAFIAAGLLAWRRGLRDNAPLGWLVIAGLCCGLAALSKTVMIFSAFAFLGTYLYDTATFGKIRPRHVAVPAIAGAAVLLAWLALKSANHAGAAASADATLAAYRNYLVFSLRSTGAAAKWLFRQPSQLAALAAALWVTPIIFRRRYDPALVVLWMLAVFYAFWWTCFTPARLPRYIWYSDAIGACFTGMLLVHLLRRSMLPRMIAVAIAALFLWNGAGEMRRVWTSDELRDERALAAYVAETTKQRDVVTVSWPVAGLVNFLADRAIEIVRPDQTTGKVLIVDSNVNDAPRGRAPARRFGRYLVYEEQVQ
jgi:4-amino-4-deoxy-L-arabinose transferase-like glycosyltransferase